MYTYVLFMFPLKFSCFQLWFFKLVYILNPFYLSKLNRHNLFVMVEVEQLVTPCLKVAWLAKDKNFKVKRNMQQIKHSYLLLMIFSTLSASWWTPIVLVYETKTVRVISWTIYYSSSVVLHFFLPSFLSLKLRLLVKSVYANCTLILK